MSNYYKGKRILIASHGSRGDCQPFIALACGLRDQGFQTVVFSNPDHMKLCTDLGISFVTNHLPFKEVFTSDGSSKAFVKNNFLQFLQVLGAHNKKHGAKHYETYYKLIESFEPDLVICGTQHWPDVTWIPLLFPIPALAVNLSNAHTVDHYQAPFGLPSLPFGLNYFMWKLVFGNWAADLKKSWGHVLANLSGKLVDEFFPSAENVLATFHGIQPDYFDFMPYFIAQDDHFVGKKPNDSPCHTYVGNMVLHGEDCKGVEFGGEKVAAMDAFIAACGEEPPIYIGWGSIKVISAKWMSLMAVRTLKLTGRKGIILGGWAGAKEELLEGEVDSADLITYSKANVFFIDTAAHELLFPKCAVVVHHGGAGTTVAGARSGRPNIVTPIIYDQFDSGNCIVNCGQGVCTKPLPTLKPQELADQIKAVLADSEMIKKAADLGMTMRQRDGVQECTTHIINFFLEDLKGGKTSKYWQGIARYAAKKRDAAAKSSWTPFAILSTLSVVTLVLGVRNVIGRGSQAKLQ